MVDLPQLDRASLIEMVHSKDGGYVLAEAVKRWRLSNLFFHNNMQKHDITNHSPQYSACRAHEYAFCHFLVANTIQICCRILQIMSQLSEVSKTDKTTSSNGPSTNQPVFRIAMDIVGPLPRSHSGMKYVLVICEYATRYPSFEVYQ